MNKIVLTITMQPDGEIQISGPLGNKVLCYGMIEAAKDAVRDYVEKAAQPSIISASMIPAIGPNGRLT